MISRELIIQTRLGPRRIILTELPFADMLLSWRVFMRNRPMNLTDSTLKNVFGFTALYSVHFTRPLGKTPYLILVPKTAKHPLSNWFDPMDTLNRQVSFPLNPCLESSA